MKLYEVHTGGAVYWLAMEPQVPTFKLIWPATHLISATTDEEHEIANIIEVPRDHWPLWAVDAMGSATEPCVLSCSEWP